MTVGISLVSVRPTKNRTLAHIKFNSCTNANRSPLRDPNYTTNTMAAQDEKKLTKDREAFADTVFQAVLGAQLVQTAYLGYKLGWYQALAENTREDGLTPLELAAATNSSGRYAREWLEQQTVSGWIQCCNPKEEDPDARRFDLPEAHAEVLTNTLDMDYMMPFPVIQAAWGKEIDKLVDAYKNNTGVSWEEMSLDVKEQQAASNRPFFLQGLPKLLEEHLDEKLVERLKTTDAKVADIGIGYGWSSIGVAKHFPCVTVDGYDLDEASTQVARKNIAIEELDSRVTAHCKDAARVIMGNAFEPYDLVMALECIHDLNDPISVLKTMRLLSGENGTVIVMDERVAVDFSQAMDNNPVEQAMYGFSCLCCLADGKSRPNSVETGTVMRPKIFRMYAQQAGFREIEILPIEHAFFRFYKLIK